MTSNELPDSVKKENNEGVKSIIEKLKKDLHPQTDIRKENEKTSEAPHTPETPNVPETSNDEHTR
ncbi:MAG: hypothetical protein V4612_03015 [Pseudomonadota bacterium]